MFVHLAKARHRCQMRAIHAFINRAGILSGRADPGDAVPGNHDLLIVMPAAAVDVEQAADSDGPRRPSLAQRHERQMLANTHFVGGIDQQVRRQDTHVIRPSSSAMMIQPRERWSLSTVISCCRYGVYQRGPQRSNGLHGDDAKPQSQAVAGSRRHRRPATNCRARIAAIAVCGPDSMRGRHR
ncbi:hypothetical protein D9M68_766590 [compost metagenome]